VIACMIVAKLSFLNDMTFLDALITVQSALAAVYLIIQGWVDFKPDIRSLAILSHEIDARVRHIEVLTRGVVENTDVKRIRDLCGRFALDIDAALSEGWRDEVGQSNLSAEKERVDRISEALKAPLPEVSEALRRMREAQ
jgi:hypothetical protein